MPTCGERRVHIHTSLFRGLDGGGASTSCLPVSIQEPPAMVVCDLELQEDNVRGRGREARDRELEQWEHTFYRWFGNRMMS